MRVGLPDRAAEGDRLPFTLEVACWLRCPCELGAILDNLAFTGASFALGSNRRRADLGEAASGRVRPFAACFAADRYRQKRQ